MHVHVLVVDDDAAIGATLKSAFETEGFTVSLAENGTEALNQILRRDRSLVVVLDQNLPDIQGEDVLATSVEYERLLDEVAFVVMTTETNMTSRLEELMRLYGVPFVAKPFDLDVMLNTVTQLGARVAKRNAS